MNRLGNSGRWRALAAWSPPLRVVAFLLGLVVLWAPVALPLYWLSGQGYLPGGDLLPTALLYGLFVLVLPWWLRRVHGLARPWAAVGMVWSRAALVSGLRALGLGLISLGVLAGVQWGLGWATSGETVPLVGVVLGGALTALAVGLAEELLFRGWLLYELEQGFSPGLALSVSATIFALAHFIKPLAVMLSLLPQLAGLVLLGFVLGWARQHPLAATNSGNSSPPTTSLAPAIGLHGGLVWGYYILNVGQLLVPTGTVPPWVTGLQGNPLAGLLGLGLLAGLAVWFRAQARARVPQPLPPDA